MLRGQYSPLYQSTNHKDGFHQYPADTAARKLVIASDLLHIDEFHRHINSITVWAYVS